MNPLSRKKSRSGLDAANVVPIRSFELPGLDEHAVLHVHIHDETAIRQRRDIAMLWILNALVLGLLFYVVLQ